MLILNFLFVVILRLNHKYDLVVDVVDHSHELLVHKDDFQLLKVGE